MEEFDLIIIGNIAFDTNKFPLQGNKTITNNGGAGYYSLIPAALFSNNIGIVARVGKDFPLDGLKELNINLDGLKIINNSKTCKFHHTYITADGKTRTFYPEIYSEALIRVEDIPNSYYKTKYIHLSTNFPKEQLEFIKNIKEKSSATVSIDTHEAYVEEDIESVIKSFNLADIAFIDEGFDELISRCVTPIKIIKRGSLGCEYISSSEEFIAKPNKVDNVIDKTGAGDVVAGVYMSLLSNGLSNQEALAKAVEVATESIKIYGVEGLKEKYKKPHEKTIY